MRPSESACGAIIIFTCMKLHAQTAHHENGQSHAREVFVHHFRLPRRGEEMAHSDYCYVLHNNKGPGSPHASRSCLSRNRLNSDGCETRRTTFLRAHHHAHAEHVHHSHHHVVDKSYRAHRGSPFLKACGNYSAAFFRCQPLF